jgi:hypothetical protein
LTRVVALLAALALSCNEEGHDELKNPPDEAMLVDLSETADLSSADLVPGITCGSIITCVITQCGATNLTCDQMCVAGAPSSAIVAASALIGCAAISCLAGDGGAGGLGGGLNLGLLLCLQNHCSMQIANCPGLFSGGGGM